MWLYRLYLPHDTPQRSLEEGVGIGVSHGIDDEMEGAQQIELF